VGFSGQKDRWATTRQWFSVYLGAKPEPEWHKFQIEHVQLLKTNRHIKKLRRGEHQANYFKIIVRNLKNIENLESSLIRISKSGFPNYFGQQRFGRKGANLERGTRFFEGEIKASRSQRSFYLSAARSYLFNLNLASAIESDSWFDDEVGGPLYGDAQRDVEALTDKEQAILERHSSLAKGIHKNRLKLERRPYRIIPENLEWQIEDGRVTLMFNLATGIFATSLLAEIFDFNILLGEG